MTLRRQCAVIIGRIHPFDTEAQEDVHTRSTDTIPRLPHVTLHTLARCSTQLADDAHGNFGRITRGRHDMSRALLLRHMREGRMRLVKCERLPSHVYGRPGLKREASCHCQQNQTHIEISSERTHTNFSWVFGYSCKVPAGKVLPSCWRFLVIGDRWTELLPRCRRFLECVNFSSPLSWRASSTTSKKQQASFVLTLGQRLTGRRSFTEKQSAALALTERDLVLQLLQAVRGLSRAPMHA